MFYRFARAFLWLLFHLAYRFRVEGAGNLPDGTAGRGYIVASNHRTNFDPIFVGIAIRPTLAFMAKSELFQKPFVGGVLRALKAFPVERGKGDRGAVDFAVQTVESGRVLAMFPEGTRSKDGKLQRPKSGCAVIAASSRADVVPAAVCFGERLRFRTPVTVRFGKPISFEELGVDAGVPSTIKHGSRLIMERIGGLLDGDAS